MKKVFLFLTNALLSIPLYSQDTVFQAMPGNQMQELIITANRYSQKQNTTGKVISVIGPAELALYTGRSIAEIIQVQAGMFVGGANSAPGANKELYFRGANNGNVLILVDGIPVSDPSLINNSFDLNHLNPDMIERIEILKGAQSTLWGSDAVAAVINIISKIPVDQNVTANALIAVGSYNSLKGNVGLQGKSNRWMYQAGYTYSSSGGFSAARDSGSNTLRGGPFDDDGYRQNTFQLQLHYRFTKHLKLSSLINQSDYHAAIDAGAFTDDRDYTTDNSNSIGHVRLAYERSKFQVHAVQSILKADRDFLDDSTHVGGFSTYSKGNYTGRTLVSEAYGVIKLNKLLTLVSGIQRMSQNTNQSYLSSSAFGPYTTALGDSARVFNLSTYHSIALSDQKKYSIEMGYRFNHHSIYGQNSTFTFNPAYSITGGHKISLNISTAYKIPSLYQLYSEFGNKSLNPERSINLEASIHVQSQDQSRTIRFTVFKRTIKDLITFYVDPVTFESKYINRDEQYDHGLELEQISILNKYLRLQTNFAFVDGKGREDGVDVKNLYRRPKYTLHSILSWKLNDRWTISPALRYVGKRLKGPYDAGPDYMPEYVLLDGTFQYTMTDRFKIFLDLRNITNQEYFDVPGYANRRFNGMVGVRYGLKE